MAVYSPINQNELEIFLEQYDLGSLIKYEGILEGIENTNYKLKTSKNTYILTIFEKRVDPSDLPFFINLKNHLTKKNFQCPQPIKNKNGECINLINNKYCVINSFLHGQKTLKISNSHCKQVGEMLALLHKETNDFNTKRINTLSRDQWGEILLKIEKIQNNKFIDIMPHINKELSFLNLSWPEYLPKGIIHGDVFQDNVFFKNNKFSGLIDFYFSCNDFYAYDLALTINAWCFDSNVNFEKDKFINLITGYENLRKLEEIEIKHLSVLLRGATVRILLTRIHDYIFHQKSSYVEVKDPYEYYSILKFHQNNNLSQLL